MSKALAPILRRYGYSGVMDNSGDYGRYAAIFDPADTKIVAQEIYANGGRPGAAVGAGLSAAGEKQGIRAYHGSPHDFDRFDMSKINTGEGSQAYGFGLYFAENENVAKSYQYGLGGMKSDKTLNMGDPADYASEILHKVGLGTAQSIDQAIGRLNDIKSNAQRMSPKTDEQRSQLADFIALQDAAIEKLRSGTYTNQTPNGRLYEVRINADPEDFLDWDKPLKDQPERIRSTMTKLADGEILPDWDGMQAYRSVGSQMMSNLDLESPELAKRIKDAGIPGIKYLDQGSRTGAGEGTRNYVVFDDNLIEILRKYGLLGMIGGGAVAAGLQSDQNKQTDWARKLQPGDA